MSQIKSVELPPLEEMLEEFDSGSIPRSESWKTLITGLYLNVEQVSEIENWYLEIEKLSSDNRDINNNVNDKYNQIEIWHGDVDIWQQQVSSDKDIVIASTAAVKVSELNAATSETNAASSASEGADSATAAATSERNASASETASASSETNAAKSEQSANTSETNALASEQAAKTSETVAGVSASNAATSEVNAVSSETSASGSAGTATSQADRAESEADRAEKAADSVPDDALRQPNNLSDLSDKAASRSNLQVYSQSEVDGNIAKTGGRKNLLINGDFRICQRGTLFTGVSHNEYTADRWKVLGPDSSTNLSVYPTISLSVNSAQHLIISRTADLGNVGFGVQQIIEFAGYDDSDMTVSADIRNYGSRGDGECGFEIQVSYLDSGLNTMDLVSSPVETIYQSDVFEKKSFTFKMSPRNDHTVVYMTVYLRITGNAPSLDIANVQLERGSVATDFEHTHIGTEMALCQRYYFDPRYGGRIDCWTPLYVRSSITTKRRGYATFPVAMRAEPTTIVVNASGISTTQVIPKYGSCTGVSLGIDSSVSTNDTWAICTHNAEL